MANQFQEKGSNGEGGENAREQLAAGWGQMTANMVSPNGGNGNGNGANGNGRGNGRNGRNGGSAPLPISALPLPAEEVQQEEPAPSLPTNKQGKLSPAQRARLGLDPYGDDLPEDEPPPPIDPPQQAVPEPAPAPEPQQPAPTEFEFNNIDPYAQVPAPTESVQVNPAAQQGPAAFVAQPDEQPQFRPISDEPQLRPAMNEPQLKPVSDAAGARRQGRVQTEDEYKRDNAPKGKKRRDDDSFEAVERDRNVFAFGIAWTAFAIVVTAGISFTSAIGGDPASATGPGPLVPALVSIAIGWVIVLAARAIGRGWGVLMIIPVIILFVGPYVYRTYWSTSTEDAARSYLSPEGVNAKVDVDATSVVSETVNTDRGCFGMTRTRSNNDTQVSVVTYVPTTARQQADFALAPRYAGRIPAGGDRAIGRIFSFTGGRAPAIVEVPREAPLDCANSTSAPGTGADLSGAEAQDSQ